MHVVGINPLSYIQSCCCTRKMIETVEESNGHRSDTGLTKPYNSGSASFTAYRAGYISWLQLLYRLDHRDVSFTLVLTWAAEKWVIIRKCSTCKVPGALSETSPQHFPITQTSQPVSAISSHKKAQVLLWINLICSDWCVCLLCTQSG